MEERCSMVHGLYTVLRSIYGGLPLIVSVYEVDAVWYVEFWSLSRRFESRIVGGDNQRCHTNR